MKIEGCCKGVPALCMAIWPCTQDVAVLEASLGDLFRHLLLYFRVV